MKVIDLVRAMEEIAPPSLAARWDNVGLLVGDPDDGIARVLLAIDCTRAVLAEASRAGCGAIVAYHPPIFEGQKRFVAGSVPFEAARAGVAVYSPHTALDAVDGGTNDVLADAIGLVSRAPLRPTDASSSDPRAQGGREGWGFGRVGGVPASSVRDLVALVRRSLPASQVLVVGGLDREVTRVAVCAGSGGEMIADAVAAGAELFLTGELRHHDALRAQAAGLSVVCTLHSVSERAVLGALQQQLSARLPEIGMLRSEEDREPFEVL